MSNEQKITSNITPSNKDLEILKQNFPNCFGKNGEFDFEKFKKQLSKNEINFSKESYGMDWLGKSYARLLATDETTTLLKEDEIFNQKEENKNSENLLIKGDNLEVLKHLSNAYYEKIKMIYIDPPYNTGSDGFVYADDRKFTIEELQELAGISEERAKRILDFTQSKSNSHSAWLTFMYPRLYIAKQLLKEDGVIFISIDDNEVAQLRLLMDEIFGEENFVENYIWESTFRPDNSSSIERENAQHVLLFCKSRQHLKKLEGSIKGSDGLPSLTKNSMNTGIIKFPIGSVEFYIEDGTYKKGSKSGNYNLLDDVSVVNGKNANSFRLEGKMIWGQNYLETQLNKGTKIIIKTKDFVPYSKKLDDNALAPNTIIPKDKVGDVLQGRAEVTGLFNFAIFNHPKPTTLISYLLRSTTYTSGVVLDFFAGSGTTGDAVMQLNKEDGGNRKFILAQLPELINPKSNKAAYDFVKNELKVETPTIFEITKERLVRASKKIQEENKDKPAKSEKIKCEGCGEDGEHCQSCKGEHTVKIKATKKKDLSNQDLGFKVFETIPLWEDYNFESEELGKQTSLFDESKLTKADIKSLLVTWKTYDGIPLTERLQETDLSGYTAHYSNENLYLMGKGFTTKNLKALLEKVDSDKSFNPTTIIAFGYHFESKSLREISENIKSYANKKSIDIDFITRY